MKMTFEEALEFIYENLDSIFAAVQLILLTLLNNKIKKTPTDVSTSAIADIPTPKTQPVKVDLVALKKQARAQLLDDLELFYSNKSEDEMSEEEKQRLELLLPYMQGSVQK